MKKENTASIARRMATQYWGDVQHQRKLAPGIWMFSTSGHGGIVVDTALRPALADHNNTVYYGRNQQWIIYTEQHFAAFEEDCEAVKVEWAYPEISRAIYQVWCVDEPFESWMEKRSQNLRRSLEQWNKEWLEEHPTPGWAVQGA